MPTSMSFRPTTCRSSTSRTRPAASTVSPWRRQQVRSDKHSAPTATTTMWWTETMSLDVADDPSELGFAPERLARIDAAFQRYVDDGRLPGWQIVVSRNGQVAH